MRFDTEWESFFLKALVERLLAPRFSRRVYEDELDNLERPAVSLAGEA